MSIFELFFARKVVSTILAFFSYAGHLFDDWVFEVALPFKGKMGIAWLCMVSHVMPVRVTLQKNWHLLQYW